MEILLVIFTFLVDVILGIFAILLGLVMVLLLLWVGCYIVDLFFPNRCAICVADHCIGCKKRGIRCIGCPLVGKMDTSEGYGKLTCSNRLDHKK